MRISAGLFALALFIQPAIAQDAWEAEVPVPARVHYRQSTPEQNRPTVERVRRYFAPDYSGDDQMSAVMLIVGPFLWRELQDQPELRGKGIPSIVKIPVGATVLELEGRGFHKDPADVKTLLGMVRRELQEDGGFTIRKLHPEELDLLWSMFAFDLLEDPLLLLESTHHRYVLLFVQGELLQIDDLYGASLAEPAGSAAGPHPFVEETAEHFWSSPHDSIDPSKLISGEGIQILSPDEEIHKSWSTDTYIEYCGKLMEARERVMAQAGKTGRNLSIQVEARPDGEFVTVLCTPPLPPALRAQLEEELRRVPHAPLQSVVATQLFCRVWGGASP